MKGNDEFSVFSGMNFFERYLKATRARNILPSGTSAGFHALAQGLGGAIQGMMQYESSCGTDIRNALRNSTMASRRTDSRADTDILVSHTIIQKLVTADDTFRIFALCALFYAMAQYPTPSEYRSKVSALLSNITSATYNKYRLALGNQDKDLQKPVVAVVMSRIRLYCLVRSRGCSSGIEPVYQRYTCGLSSRRCSASVASLRGAPSAMDDRHRVEKYKSNKANSRSCRISANTI